MRQFSLTFMATLILLSGIWYTDSISAKDIPSPELGVSCVGQMRGDPTCLVACDRPRGLVFVGCNEHVCILDISTPHKPRKICHFDHSALSLCDLYCDENSRRLFLSEGNRGFECWDISNHTTPKKYFCFDTPGYASGLSVNGDYVYVADADAGLLVIDVSNHLNPFQVTALEMTCAVDIVTKDSYAYVADLGLRIFDISNPEKPREISYVETPGVARDIRVEGNYAYVADDWCGIRIIDIHDKTRPQEVAQLSTCGYAWDIDMAGSNLYVAACEGGLRAVDVSNPTKPQEIAVRTKSQEALSVAVTGQHAYVAQAMSGLAIYSPELTRGNTTNSIPVSNLVANQ